MKNKNLPFKESEQRVFFKNSNVRAKFFSELKNKFGSWKDVGTYFKIYKSRLENLRNGKISIPYSKFVEFSQVLNNKYNDKITLKKSNWGRSKGGISTYKKHKEIFEKGRKLASQNKINKVDFNMKLNENVCEFIGTFIGDGFMNKYYSQYIIQITGDATLDKEHYEKILIPIIKKMSPESKPSIRKTNNTLRLTVYSKGIYKLFTERLGMKNGRKAYVIIIPDEIINSQNYRLINACLRGIYNADGCVAFDKRKTYLKPYIRIVLHMKSIKLMEQIYSQLVKQDIKATITANKENIQINGSTECKKFINKIGFSNPRHLRKIKNL